MWVWSTVAEVKRFDCSSATNSWFLLNILSCIGHKTCWQHYKMLKTLNINPWSCIYKSKCFVSYRWATVVCFVSTNLLFIHSVSSQRDICQNKLRTSKNIIWRSSVVWLRRRMIDWATFPFCKQEAGRSVTQRETSRLCRRWRTRNELVRISNHLLWRSQLKAQTPAENMNTQLTHTETLAADSWLSQHWI